MVLYFHYHLKCRHIHDKKGAIEVDLLKSSRMNFYHCYYLKLHQINMNRQDLYLCCKNLRKWSYIFIITSNVGIFMTKKGAIEVDLLKSSRMNIYHCYYLKWHQINVNRQDLYLCWQEFKKMVLYFHYHLKCRHIHDKKGAIEVYLLKSSRMNFYHCYYLKLHQINMNRQDLYLCCKNLRKWSYIFIITSNVGIFMTKKVLLKLIFWNQVGRIFIIANIWNCIKLILIDRICI